MNQEKQYNNRQTECETGDDILPMEQDLTADIEEALFRLKFEEPSVDAEWDKFNQRNQKKSTGIRKGLYILSGIAAAAVIIIAVLLIGNMPSHNSMPHKEMAVIIESIPESISEEEAQTEQDKNQAERIVPTVKPNIKSEKVVYTHQVIKKVRHNVVSIPRGQVYKLTLSDGTEVWMNASSYLSFPTRFTGPRREVKLEGEAYFKVAHDAKHPFIIKTNGMTTEVLGTEFNIKAYSGSEAHVTLVRGSVKVHLPQADQEVVLTPGDDIAYNGTNYTVQQTDISYYTQWMEGYFYYDNVSLTDVLKDLGRWYNVTIALEQDSLLLSQRLHFVADRSENIDNAIENLNHYPYLSVSKDGDRINVCRKQDYISE